MAETNLPYAASTAGAGRGGEENAFVCASKKSYHRTMNSKHRKTLIETLLLAAGAEMVEGSGSRVTFLLAGRRADCHRPHLGKEALRYRVQAVREFLAKTGIKS